MNDAIKSNDIAAVKSLLADGSVDVNARISDAYNSPLLVLAADRGHVEIVALLLDEGARIDDFNDNRNTACHIAVFNGHTAVVELLVARKRKANVSLRNRYSESPIDIAIAKKSDRILMLLIDAAMAPGTPPGDETICYAATVSVDVIRLLLFKYGINLSTIRGSGGRTPLHLAVWRKSDAVVFKMLVEAAGIDVDARDHFGDTAAHYSCSISEAGALACLIAAGANLDLVDDNGKTSRTSVGVNRPK